MHLEVKSKGENLSQHILQTKKHKEEMLKLGVQLLWQLEFAKFSLRELDLCLNWLLLGWASTTVCGSSQVNWKGKLVWAWSSLLGMSSTWELLIHFFESISNPHSLSGEGRESQNFLAIVAEKRLRKKVGNYHSLWTIRCTPPQIWDKKGVHLIAWM